MFEGFNRHEVLYDSYLKTIESWDWGGLKKDCENSEPYDDFGGCIVYPCFIGTVFQIMPSGKYYMPWCSNQTKHDVERDAAFYDAMEFFAEKHGLFVFSGDDPCDLFVGFTEEKGFNRKERK